MERLLYVVIIQTRVRCERVGVNMKIRLKICKEFKVYKVCIGLVIFAMLMSSVALPNVAQAISLSSVAKKNFARIQQGETAEFTLLFWNIEDFSYVLTLSTEQAPENWTVIIAPEKIIMNQSKIGPPYDEGEYVNTNHGNVKAVPVKVYVKVPSSDELGTYEVIIRAITYPLDANAAANAHGTGVSVLLERAFTLSVKVVKSPTFFEDSGQVSMAADTIENFKNSISDVVTGMGSAVAGNPVLILLSLLTIGTWVVLWKVVCKYA